MTSHSRAPSKLTSILVHWQRYEWKAVSWLFTYALSMWILAAPADRALAAESKSSDPSELTPEDLVARTQDALGELTILEAKTQADREAFRRSEAVLRQALEELHKELPPAPRDLAEIPGFDREEIRKQAKLAEDFSKAFELRQSRRQRVSETQRLLENLVDTLRPEHEELIDRAVTLRPLLIEAQRRIDRRDLKLELFEIEESPRTIDQWIAESSDLATRRASLLKEVDDLIQRYQADAALIAKPDPQDVETARKVRQIRLTLGTFAEAQVVREKQVALFDEMRPENIPVAVRRVFAEWQARRDALDQAADKLRAEEANLREIKAERDALVAPRLEDIPEGEGLPEIRDARREVELATRRIAYQVEDLKLLEKANSKRQELLASAEEATKLHAAYSRQVGRVAAAFERLDEIARDGPIPEGVLPEGLSRRTVWVHWQKSQVLEFERTELKEKLRSEVVNAETLETEAAEIEKERESKRLAEASLETELSYAESVQRMGDRSDEELLQLLEPDGEIAKNLASSKEEISRLKEEIQSTANECRTAVGTMHTAENPYSRAALQLRQGELATIRQNLEGLQPGDVPPDESTSLIPPEDFGQTGASHDERDFARASITEIADAESEHLALRQQEARIFLEYYQQIENGLKRLLEAVEARKQVDTRIEDKINALIQEEKRRYAAARELRLRLDAGKLEAAKAPEKIEQWLGRDAIRQATEELRVTRRENSRFQDRASYEIERFETITTGTEWIRVRSKAADARARLIGRPVALLTSAMTPLNDLDDVDRKKLEYEAAAAEAEEAPAFLGLLERFTSLTDRERFETPLASFHLELANTQRVTRDLEAAEDAYRNMIESCVQEKEALQPLRPRLDKILELRLLDYHAARFGAAVALHPDRVARMEEEFRDKHRRDLPYRLNFEAGNRSLVVDILFGTQARVIADRKFLEDADLALSKVGIEQDIGWYNSQIARIGSLLEVQKSRMEDFDDRIRSLRTSYIDMLKLNMVTGLGVTLIIPVVAFLIVRFLRTAARRIEARVIRGDEDEANSDRKRRLQTISKMSTASISVLVWTIAIIYIFARLGLDITPIIASASVVGLAVAFGAQALIRDFFTGFFVLVEKQFTIGDIVNLGNISGVVEDISLRITVLRDLKGVVHYIPNGSINQVSNMTQGWSRVVLEISVPYSEDPDRIAQVLGDTLLEMARNEVWKVDILEDPVVAGVENLTERSVDIRVMVKTRPGKQWDVARETRRRIKKKFDELGISIPFPHRIVHHVYEGKEPPPQESREAAEAADED